MSSWGGLQRRDAEVRRSRERTWMVRICGVVLLGTDFCVLVRTGTKMNLQASPPRRPSLVVNNFYFHLWYVNYFSLFVVQVLLFVFVWTRGKYCQILNWFLLCTCMTSNKVIMIFFIIWFCFDVDNNYYQIWYFLEALERVRKKKLQARGLGNTRFFN